ncbi:hypothetical protein SAMN04487910_0199 [Aquimarina amphilecti]|uniref:Fibronectin type-III domain-containing protein n=1 Tax=Aquimarina amphilecti TaxID=1038014 RepID=A0A1H7FWM8_AQUAM|nr:hypothetical protein [Aquimarina amphilecti]SEK30194.1 hypothetical protein SAMN04487910_0199 [Aquimarina amphilecti]
MRKYVKYITIAYIGFFIGCDDIIEDDITNDIVTTVAPQDMTQIEGNSVQFRWNQIDGADEYRIQINNQSSNAIILDSLVNTTLFNYAMNPGTYQWRVRGENFAYDTAYSFNSSFSVISSIDLSGQTVLLNSPLNNLYTNDVAITFSWEGISTATFYKFQILRVDGSEETVIFEDQNVVDTSITIGNTIITEDAEYIWQVSAENDTSFTDYFRRTFFIDTQNPVSPSLITPAVGQNFTTSQEVNFTWNFNNDTGTIQSGIIGTIQIASDENFSNIVLSESNATGNFINTFDTTGAYYWRVRGVDEAGNTGDYNASGQFNVN